MTVKNLILREEVPLTTCLVVAAGLPNSGKTTALESTFRENIFLKQDAKYPFEHYLNRKKNEKCLSVYELCVLGGAPRDQFQWSFATNRCGAVFSILHVLARRKIIDKSSQHYDINSLFDEHIHWLVEAVTSQMTSIESEKLELIQDGLSLINVLDVGVNKAIYEFLQTVMSCRRHIRLAFFSLERDAPNFAENPDVPSDRYGERGDDMVMMKQGSRLGYLFHFATLGYEKDQQNNCTTVMIATSTETTPNPLLFNKAKKVIEQHANEQGVLQYLKSWEIINTSNKDQMKDVGMKIQELIRRKYYSKVHIPLRWIILRSLVTSLEKGNSKAIIMKKSFIIEQADYFEMDRAEVESFLGIFSDFGSILYMPQFKCLRDIVIVDIYEFAQCIDQLFYPKSQAPYSQNLLKYGIIAQEEIKKLLPSEITDDFITILKTFAMVAEIKSPSRIVIEGQVQSEVETFFYLPSARITKYDTMKENDYIVLHIEGASFPSSLQAGISHEIMKNENTFLVAIEDCNTSKFLFKYEDSSSIEIHMIYRDRKTHLRINSNSVDVLQSSEAIDACSKVLTATFECLQSITQTLRGVKYSVAIPCSKSDSDHHYLYRSHRSNLCETCIESKEEFRFCWSNAAKKVILSILIIIFYIIFSAYL